MMDRDVELAESLLDARFQLMLVQPASTTMPRARWLEVLPGYVMHEYHVQSQQLDVDGDTAAVLSLVVMKATVLGEDRSGVFVISDIWRQRGDGWRLWRRRLDTRDRRSAQHESLRVCAESVTCRNP